MSIEAPFFTTFSTLTTSFKLQEYPMNKKKRKLDQMQSESDCFLDNPSALPSICYQLIFQQLPLESLLSVALTCRTWYNILCTNRSCFNRNTKITLSNEHQLIHASASNILRHVNKIELGALERGFSTTILTDFQLHFTSLHTLKLCFASLSPEFITNLFQSLSPTLQKLILAIDHKSTSTDSCLSLLSSLHLLPNLTHFSLLVKTSTRIVFDIEKYFRPLPKLEKLILRQDHYICKRNYNEQLAAIQYLPNLKHFQWFELAPADLRVLVSLPSRPPLQYIHLQETLITNEVLFYLSQIPTMTTLKSHRFSPLRAKLNVEGFHHLLALKGTLKELEISAKNIQYDELMIVQHPTEADCSEDEYEVQLTSEHVDILKQFVHLTTLSFNNISIRQEDMDDLFTTLAQRRKLRDLTLDSVCFPSLAILSQAVSLQELDLSHPRRSSREQYTDQDFRTLHPLKNLQVLVLYYSFNLSARTRKQLRRASSTAGSSAVMFEQLEEFIYNDDAG